jgi:preprotein translocase subunit SecE
MNDKIKLAIAALVVVAGFIAFYAFSNWIFAARLGLLLLGFGGGVAIAWFTETGRRLLEFVRESWAEAKKVVWPTRKETLQTTGIVVLFVVVMAISLWVIDLGVGALIAQLMGWGR